jgi:hypothetical protein
MQVKIWRLAVALLLAQTISVPLCQARGGGGGAGGGIRAGGGNFSAGVHTGDLNGLGRNWWGGGGLGYGYPMSGAGQWWGMDPDDPNTAYYNSPAPTSLPAISADDPVDVQEKMAEDATAPHQVGPSMSFQSDVQSTTDTFSQFNRDFDDIAGPVTYVPYPVNTSVSAALRPPRISRKYPTLAKGAAQPGGGVSFDSTATGDGAFADQVQAKIDAVQSVLTQAIAGGTLGTFDVSSLQQRLDGIKSRFAASQGPGGDASTQAQMLSDLSQLQYDIQQHAK